MKPCPDHHRTANAHRSTWRNRGEQAAFRRRILAAAGHRCEYVDPATGERCDATTHLEAHHDSEVPNGGRALCGTKANGHHRAMDPYAR